MSAGSGRIAGHGSFRLSAACGSGLGQIAGTVPAIEGAVPAIEGAVPTTGDAGKRLKFWAYAGAEAGNCRKFPPPNGYSGPQIARSSAVNRDSAVTGAVIGGL